MWLSIHASYTSPSGLWFQETSLSLLSLSLLCSLQECFSERPWSWDCGEKDRDLAWPAPPVCFG